jgi:hypothetical protein
LKNFQLIPTSPSLKIPAEATQVPKAKGPASIPENSFAPPVPIAASKKKQVEMTSSTDSPVLQKFVQATPNILKGYSGSNEELKRPEALRRQVVTQGKGPSIEKEFFDNFHINPKNKKIGATSLGTQNPKQSLFQQKGQEEDQQEDGGEDQENEEGGDGEDGDDDDGEVHEGEGEELEEDGEVFEDGEDGEFLEENAKDAFENENEGNLNGRKNKLVQNVISF